MIEDEEVRRGGPEEEMIRLAQQGKIETILDCHKRSINLAELLPFPPRSPQPLVVLPPPPPGRLCLIEGAPGGGKSTLALHICHQWAQGASWLSEFNVVVLAYLRDQEVQNAKTLAEILPAASNVSVCASIMQASYGKQVLFIFDGWDEFPDHQMNDSLVSTIIRQPHKLSLHQSTILVTTRPVSSGNLLHIADRRVEILGFTQLQIHEYIEKALDGNSARVQKLVQHLDEHPVIKGYCYVPLHVAILVHIFLTMKGALPTTLHELFCFLVLCCIVREQATHDPNTSLPELSSLDDLPDDLKSKLSNLSKLAYNGVVQDKVVFYSKDLRTVHLPVNLPSLGLLQAVEGLALYSKSLSYNFLHLSVQELLAAHHISQMASIEQVKVFMQLFIGSSRFQAVLHYYSGFTKLNNPEIQNFISSYQANISEFTRLIPLLHCFFEAQQPSLCQLVATKFIPSEHHKLISENCVPIDFVAIGFFITSLLSTSVNTSTISLAIEHIDDHRLQLLLSELLKYPVGGLTTAGVLSGKQLELDLNAPYITYRCAVLIASLLKEFSFISKLTLCNGEIHHCEDGLLHIAEALQTNSSLTSLSLRNMKLQRTEQNDSALTMMLQVNKSLTHLDLSNNDRAISVSGTRIFEGLQHNTTLVYLGLSVTGITAIDECTARSLTKMLQVNKSLKNLYLTNCSYFGDSQFALPLFQGLEHNNTLLQLTMQGLTITDDAAAYLGQILISNRSLRILNINGCSLGINGNYYILDALKFSTALKQLYFNQHCLLMEKFCEEVQTARREKGLSPVEIITLKQNYWSDTAAVTSLTMH